MILPVIKLAPLVLLAGCQTVVTTPPADCTGFIPDAWQEPVAGYPLPPASAGDDARQWQAFGVGQTGQLAKANGQKADILHIVGECERRANDARPRQKWMGLF